MKNTNVQESIANEVKAEIAVGMRFYLQEFGSIEILDISKDYIEFAEDDASETRMSREEFEWFMSSGPVTLVPPHAEPERSDPMHESNFGKTVTEETENRTSANQTAHSEGDQEMPLVRSGETLHDDQVHKGFAFNSLDAVRKKLIDLSNRNNLLNYRHPKASCLRIIDELPDQIVEVLVSGKSFTFIPVPEPNERELIKAGYIQIDPVTRQKKYLEYPTAEQWAKYLGLHTAYELPGADFAANGESRHQDTKLQTLMYASELESRCRNIRSKAETAIEESGSNILYLVLGFLEWTESRISNVSRLAPLFTLPVRMERKRFEMGEGTFRYTITLKDDGLLTNVPLREKLANDFGLILPALEDDMAPEDYFRKVSNTVLRENPTWRIRRQATLALLNFSKLVMYEDLNPENWPTGAAIENHPIIKKFFSSEGAEYCETEIGYSSEHPIDDVVDIHHHFPLIYESDSSQHSALIDAVGGENLVIEGPPGTGKSQTITNLIGASIANGKKVLFVAEKMAALDVVKRRLDSAGLGDFCLELHSHKTQKQKILTDLQHRINKQGRYRSPDDINDDIARFENLKETLKSYVEVVNRQWKNSGLTAHEILQKATRYRKQLNIDPDQFKIDGLSGETFSKIKQKELFDQADMLANIYDQVASQAASGEMCNHYWYGVNNIDLAGYQGENFRSLLQDWTEQLVQVKLLWEQQISELQLGLEMKASIEALQEFVEGPEKLPNLLGKEPLTIAVQLSKSVEQFEQCLKDYQEIHGLIQKLSSLIRMEVMEDKESLQKIENAESVLRKLGAEKQMPLQALDADLKLAKRLLECSELIKEGFGRILPNIPPSLSSAFDVSEKGLQEFLTLNILIGKLPTDLWRDRAPLYDDNDLDSLLEQFLSHLSLLSPMQNDLLSVFSLHRLPSFDVLNEKWQTYQSGGGLRFLSSRWRNARKELFSLASSPKPDKRNVIQLMPRLFEYSQGLSVIDELNQKVPLLGDLYRGVETPIGRIVAIRNWYKEVRKEYGQGFGARVPIGDALLHLDRNVALAIHEYASQSLGQLSSEFLDGLAELRKRFPGFSSLKNPKVNLAEEASPLAQLSTQIQTLLMSLENIVISPMTSFNQLSSTKEWLTTLHAKKANWVRDEIKCLLNVNGLQLSVDPGEHAQEWFETANNLLKISRVLRDSPPLSLSLSNQPSVARYEALQSAGSSLKERLAKCLAAKEPFFVMGQISQGEWLESSSGEIGALVEKNDNALSNPHWLETWLEYLRLKKRLSEKGLTTVINKLEENRIKTSDLQDVLALCVYHLLAKELLAEERSLAAFSGLEQNAIRSKFAEYDCRLMKLQQEKIAFRASRVRPPAGISSGRVSEYTEMGLINQEMGKKKRHIAVRSLIKRAGRAIQSQKPCFMMSPMSVAQYLEPGKFKFDLVVMDEASQIKPEDALGSVARGNSLVVVGDPKQLPPTAFFERVIEEDPGEDQVALQESESILESVIPMFKNRRLRWHYRSRHESLIAFSNQNFYDSDLIIFPSPFQKSDDLGIRFERVARGRFHNRRNVEEARRIVAGVTEQLINCPCESVGIVAMNTEQRDEIELQLDQMIKENDTLRVSIERNQVTEEPYFIKNLENVQGDERDVVFISMTYGPEQVGGRTMQRFGPINSNVGWRRLNVLFTRSKKRMHIYSSMGSGDILVSSNSSRGVRALRAFLEYCETGHFHHSVHTGRPADSDFEVAVIKQLSEHGYECEPQLGVAGYFLDLAVRDPGQPGRFLMGIECDGATYHSAKSVRDRDRLRQEILEGLGWKIARIWSTDWFKNCDACLIPILQELEALKTPIADNASIDFPALDESIPYGEEAPEYGDSAACALVGELEEPALAINLRDMLLEFNQDVIEKETPGTDPEKRLLRPAMLESLLNHKPCSKGEFLEFIPGHLRSGTAASEGKYITPICELIADYG